MLTSQEAKGNHFNSPLTTIRNSLGIGRKYEIKDFYNDLNKHIIIIIIIIIIIVFVKYQYKCSSCVLLTMDMKYMKYKMKNN